MAEVYIKYGFNKKNFEKDIKLLNFRNPRVHGTVYVKTGS